LDVGSVFHWNLREIEDTSKADKTKKTLEQIPDKIPPGFNLRVECNSLHENSLKRMARCKFGSVPMCFAMPEDAPLGRLKERVRDCMNQRGQGVDWTISGADREQIDFDFEYEVEPIEREIVYTIVLKQKPIEVRSSETWIDVSDRLVRTWNFPSGTLIRIFPVIGSVDHQDLEDHSYSVTWEEGKNNIGMILPTTTPGTAIIMPR
jgi:hypothetical protein